MTERKPVDWMLVKFMGSFSIIAIVGGYFASSLSDYKDSLMLKYSIEGIVKEEFGNSSAQSNNPNYGLVLNTFNGNYTLQIYNGYNKPMLALERAIEAGDRIKINPDCNTYFGNDKIGRTSSDTIEIVEKAKN